MSESELVDAWKNKNVFLKQLECNVQELASKQSYPPHWNASIELIEYHEPKTLLDIGCGCGAFCEVCFRNLPNVLYTGMDYSEDAVEIAKEKWNKDAFFVKDVWDLTEEDIEPYDLLYMGALLDVRPDADAILEHIFKLKPKALLISRMKLTDAIDSYIETYDAYDEITTCAFYHSGKKFVDMCKENGYTITQINDNYYLTREDSHAESD